MSVLESSDDYEAFEAAVISDYNAETAVERQLVLRLASVLWRLRRATSIETAIFDSANEYAAAVRSAKSTSEVDPKATIADSYLQLSALQSFPLDRLSRYESTLWRHARQIISTLDSLRRQNGSQGELTFPSHFVVGPRARSPTVADSGSSRNAPGILLRCEKRVCLVAAAKGVCKFMAMKPTRTY